MSAVRLPVERGALGAISGIRQARSWGPESGDSGPAAEKGGSADRALALFSIASHIACTGEQG